jgi:hypothetical protein
LARAASAASAASAEAPAGPPAFPYRWIGSIEDESGPRVFLANAERTLSVRSGERIDAQWQLQAIETGQLQVLWMPGQQALQVSGS